MSVFYYCRAAMLAKKQRVEPPSCVQALLYYIFCNCSGYTRKDHRLPIALQPTTLDFDTQ